jgi:CDP-diacylglycerol--glycerol-3-phosphate 3-phosphatidyltransferase
MSSSEWWLGRGRLWNVPNTITLSRLVLALACGTYGVANRSLVFLVVAYGIYWVGDMADGWTARLLDSQTRFGALFDIFSDRASTGMLACGLLVFRPDGWLAITVFLVQFMVVDTLLSSSFLWWGLKSPNDFAQVDEDVYRWNWSPLAKGTNTAVVVLLVVFNLPWIAVVVATAVLLIKLKSLERVARLMATGANAPIRTSV